MRGVFITVKAFFVVGVIAFCLAFVYALAFSPVFGGGKSYEFYKGTSSDEIICASSPLKKILLTGIKGESARYTGNKVEELISAYRAQPLFTEEAAGIINYYCYSPLLSNGLELNGQTINLHIACNGNETAAGTPVIFGGF